MNDLLALPMLDLVERCPSSGDKETRVAHASEMTTGRAELRCPGCGAAFDLPVAPVPSRTAGGMYFTSDFSSNMKGPQDVFAFDPVPEHERTVRLVDTTRVDLESSGSIFIVKGDDYDCQQIVGVFNNLGNALRSQPGIRWTDVEVDEDGISIEGTGGGRFSRYFVSQQTVQ